MLANLVEVFSAIQGEGANVGTRQIFIRFGGCDLRCHYCDSQNTWVKVPQCQIEVTPGARDFQTFANPVTIALLTDWVVRQNQPAIHDSISITGGEPLLQAPFLREFLPVVKARTGLPIYLETGGHRSSQLATVIEAIDSIGMDIKLPSASGEEKWREHEEFLQVCKSTKKQVFTKLIIAKSTTIEELTIAAKIIAKVDPQIETFLQPVTPLAKPHSQNTFEPPTPAQVLQFQAAMKQYLPRTRVIPQTHKFIDQM
jgi:7-carboxy-7-deazaguanine synthase